MVRPGEPADRGVSTRPANVLTGGEFVVADMDEGVIAPVWFARGQRAIENNMNGRHGLGGGGLPTP